MARPDVSPIVGVPVLGPYMDVGRHPSKLQQGTFSRVVGADGRALGSIKPFPGFVRQTLGSGYDIRSVSGCEDVTAVNWAKYVQVQKGAAGSPSATLLSGWLMRVTDDGTVKLVFVYYDGSAWASHFVYSGTAVSATARVDVAAFGMFMYVAVESDANYPRTVYHNGTAWQDVTMGPGWTTLTAPTPTESSTTGILEIGTYGIAYRFSHSVRRVYSGMSNVAFFDITDATKAIDVSVPHPGGGTDVYGRFDTIEVFRTISTEVAGSTFAGGILYKCTTQAISAAWTSGAKTVIVGDSGEPVDVQLVQLDEYDPWEDESGEPPGSGAICHYQGTTFMGQDPALIVGGCGIRWSPTTTLQPEQFAQDHVYRGRLGDGVIERLLDAGDVLYGLTAGAIYRIRKVGTDLTFHRMHEGRGTPSRMSAHGVGSDLLLLTPLGISVVSGLNGDMAIHSEVDRIIYGDWKASLANVVSCFDAYMGASFFVNTSRNEAIVLWHSTKLATLLTSFPFVAATSGAHPVSGGAQRAFFISAKGVIVYPDSDGSGTRTTAGVSGTVNGTVTTASATALVDSAATFHDSAVYAYVRLLSGSLKNNEYLITAKNSTTSLAVTFGATVAVGTRYTISPIPFELKLPPLANPRAEGSEIVRTVLRSVRVYATGHTGISGNGNALWRVGAYREGSTTLDTTYNEVAMEDGDVSQVPSTSAPGSIDGFQLEPFVGAYVAGASWELTGLEFFCVPGRSRGGLG